MPAVDHHGWGPEMYTDYHASWVLIWVYSQKIYMSHRRSGRKPKPFLTADICRSMDSKIPEVKSKNVCRGSAFTQPLHFSRHNCSFYSLSEKQMANHTIKVSVKQDEVNAEASGGHWWDITQTETSTYWTKTKEEDTRVKGLPVGIWCVRLHLETNFRAWLQLKLGPKPSCQLQDDSGTW